MSLPVYPGDTVRRGTGRGPTGHGGGRSKDRRKRHSGGATSPARGARVAQLTHHLHHQAALDQAHGPSRRPRSRASLDAQSEAQADQDAIADMQAGVQSAQANADYWKTEIVTGEAARRRGRSVTAGVSERDWPRPRPPSAALSQAHAKVSQARATAASARAKTQMARRQVAAAQAGVRMAQADIAVAQGQAQQAEEGAFAARAAARTAAVQQGYSPHHIAVRRRGDGAARRPRNAGAAWERHPQGRRRSTECVCRPALPTVDLAGVRVGSPVQHHRPGRRQRQNLLGLVSPPSFRRPVTRPARRRWRPSSPTLATACFLARL